MAYDAYDAARDLRNAANKIENYKRHQEKIEDDIRLLKLKRNTIVNMKELFRETRKKDKAIIKGKYKWKGSWYSKYFKRDTGKLMDAEDSYCENCLDHILDSINLKILELENERNRISDSLLFWRRAKREAETWLDNITN